MKRLPSVSVRNTRPEDFPGIIELCEAVYSDVAGGVRRDPESLGHAAVIEWLNPEAAHQSQEPSPDRRFGPRTSVSRSGEAG